MTKSDKIIFFKENDFLSNIVSIMFPYHIPNIFIPLCQIFSVSKSLCTRFLSFIFAETRQMHSLIKNFVIILSRVYTILLHAIILLPRVVKLYSIHSLIGTVA